MSVAKLDQDITDTLMVLNSELYLQTIQVYAFAKVNNRDGRYDSFIALLKPYFTHPRKPAASTTPAPTT